MTDNKKTVDVEELKRLEKEMLFKRRNAPTAEEREYYFKEYSKVHFKIKYYSNQEYKAKKLQENKEYNEGLKDNEYYKEAKRKYFVEYYQKHKNDKNINSSVACC